MDLIRKEKKNSTFLHLHGLPSRGGTSSPRFERNPLMMRASGHRHGCGGHVVAWLVRWGGGGADAYVVVRHGGGAVHTLLFGLLVVPCRCRRRRSSLSPVVVTVTAPAPSEHYLLMPPQEVTLLARARRRRQRLRRRRLSRRRRLLAAVGLRQGSLAAMPPMIHLRSRTRHARCLSGLGIDHRHRLAYLTDLIGSEERDWWRPACDCNYGIEVCLLWGGSKKHRCVEKVLLPCFLCHRF